jgi:TolB-like protein/DNA-binding SARP family transcriptional activator/Flp pilus assembly protein TadD
MLHLKTFGGLSVAVDGSVPGAGAAQQRKTLALLAILAASGRTGVSRDKIVAYLWPEADSDHARGLLKQACYALRRDLHQPHLFIGVTQLRLNSQVMASDVQAFETALERGDQAEAAELYTGPFLDGFYLSVSAEFERWVEMERGRLHRRACAALETLANDAAASADYAKAVGWWRQLAVLEPLNSRVALGLMGALAATGDRAGALEVAYAHETLLRDDLNAKPDMAILQLTERLRSASESVLSSPYPANVGAAAGMLSDRRSGPFKRAVAGSALVVAGLVVTAWLLFRAPFGVRSAETVPAPKRIVVIPFTNLGPVDDQYFADGITDEITARLAAIDRLRVIGSTSANRYRNSQKTIGEIGTELGVDYVLEGSVGWQKSREGPARVRVIPQLVSVTDGTHLWAEVYDAPLGEIFRVQSDVARKVVESLGLTLLDQQRDIVQVAPTDNLEAYEYYLRGNDYERRGHEERSVRTALRMYEKAIELDARFALAHARLSQLHSRMYWFYYDRMDDRRARAKRAADSAFALAPGLPEAHAALGAYYMGEREYEPALREFAIAASKRPGIGGPLVRAVIRTRQGKLREALEEFDQAWQLDPASSIVASNYAHTYDLLRDFDSAEALQARAIALAPDRAYPYFWKAWLYMRWDGGTKRARAVLNEARAVGIADEPRLRFAQVCLELLDRNYEEAIGQISSTPVIIEDQFRVIPKAQLLAEVYAQLQRHDLARAYYDSARTLISAKVQERPQDARLHSALGIADAGVGRKQEAIAAGMRAVELLPISRDLFAGQYHVLDLARIYTMVGEHDAAIERLEYLLSIPGHLTVAWLRIDPAWDPLRKHPRFQKLVRHSS